MQLLVGMNGRNKPTISFEQNCYTAHSYVVGEQKQMESSSSGGTHTLVERVSRWAVAFPCSQQESVAGREARG